MEGERGAGAPEGADFAETLATLKRKGNNILLVGAEPPDAHTSICHRLLGEAESEPRCRLFVTNSRGRVATDGQRVTDDHCATDDRCATDEATVPVRTIDYSELTIAESADVDAVSDRTPLGTLGIEIIETVDELDDDVDGLEPSELRVCVDSLVPLLEEHTAEKVFRLLHMTTSRVEHVHGMGHYHLPLDRDHEAVRLLEPMFDVVVEVRACGGSYQQRWELRDRESPTDWISF